MSDTETQLGSDTASRRELESLKRQRRAFKGQLTQFRNKLPTLTSLGSIESNIRRLQLMYDKYHLVQLKIEIQDENASADRVTFEEDYEYVESTLMNKLHELKKLESHSKEAVNFESSSNSTMLEQSVPAMSIKLPELKLPTFNGSESDWMAFRDVFRDIIHNKTTIDSTVKFVYLTSCIRSGKAYNLIENLPVTSDNYEAAWKILCNRYDNAILIQKAHMKSLYDIKSPSENSSVSLQHFIDNSNKNYNALKSLHIQVDTWDLMLIHHLTEKLDNSTKVHVIKNSESNKLLTFDKFIAILRNRVRILEAIQGTKPKQSVDSKRFNYSKAKSTSLISNSFKCSYCSGVHPISNCPEFSDDKVTPQMRYQFIRNNQLCSNCLVCNHKVGACDKPPCSICSLKHHTLLHFGSRSSVQRYKGKPGNKFSNTNKLDQSDSVYQNKSPESNLVQTAGISSCKLLHKPAKNVEQILIGTALLNVTGSSNNNVLCRALLDSGSHLNFVTESLVNLLKIRKQITNKIISGIGGTETTINTKVSLTISSRVSNFSISLDFFVIPKITNQLPASPVNVNLRLIPAEIELADPYFHVPNKIDILLGAEIYNELFNGNSITVLKNLPPFYPTVFGYVISGRVTSIHVHDECLSTVLCTNESLKNDIQRFWELESISVKNHYSLEEKYCEEHYAKTQTRTPSGRYVVSLPVNDNINNLGLSNFSSLKQFYSIERKLIQKPEIYNQYQDFMKEYLSLDHMKLVNDPNISNSSDDKSYYLPHHYVIKDSSTTTQLRVVFNGSAKSSSKISLNDCLYKGPTVQQDLLSIILRFRTHIVAFTADIAKMYRQILIDEKQQDLQRIWWRDSPLDDIKCYKLCTVTYGTKSAPYLATRTLQQLASDEVMSFPSASNILMNDFYVDDVLTGSHTIDEALKLKLELQKLLEKGGFQLRKFSSNIPIISSSSEAISDVSLVLGLSWNTCEDEFEINFSKVSLNTACTKRNMLSEICQLFDPLGLCSPVILVAKIIMQTIWTLPNIDWDDLITHRVCDEWVEFKRQLIELNRISVPRCILVPEYKFTQIHGFADASERGFGCVLYLRVTDSQNKQHIRMICSKSRVAPLKKQTIPRLELCAALLLVQTLTKVINSLNLQYNHIYLWSDSEVTLFRIKSEPAKFSAFVANRVTQIQELSALHSWCYVPTTQNPADLVSRGVMPDEFLRQRLWWSGPSFLLEDQCYWPKNSNQKISSELLNLDVRKNASISVCNSESLWNIFERYSSFTKLIRVTAYIIRFINYLKDKERLKITGELTSNELDISITSLVKIVQQVQYGKDIQNLTRHGSVQITSNLKLLNPFLDEFGLLRVGGRLRNSGLNYSNKYPLVLPNNHLFSKLLVQAEHIRLLHCGPQTLLYNLRSKYWIIGGRNLCRQIVNKCIHCFKNKPTISHEKMGDLPADRVTQSRPFSVVGIDFCGPFFAKPNHRSKSKTKIYICLFICFAVKAIHLEIVMDLTTQSFLACLRRFISRRGYCTKIYSDNATNFIGCRTELKDLRNLFFSELCQNETKRFCASHNIEWLTIPPRSPHFGGLWESGIKSAKWHLKRVVGLRSMTLEEYYTLISQIEACLNSKPLTAVSNDPSDYTALSPGHFLIGRPLLALPEPSMLDLNVNRLTRYQTIQVMFQDFWKRWHIEYLNELQKRYKWQKASNEHYKIGDLVLVHEDNVPPINWVLGRIVELHPGLDKRVRVVSVRTAKSTFKRSITKISILPLETINDTL